MGLLLLLGPPPQPVNLLTGRSSFDAWTLLSATSDSALHQLISPLRLAKSHKHKPDSQCQLLYLKGGFAVA